MFSSWATIGSSDDIIYLKSQSFVR